MYKNSTVLQSKTNLGKKTSPQKKFKLSMRLSKEITDIYISAENISVKMYK